MIEGVVRHSGYRLSRLLGHRFRYIVHRVLDRSPYLDSNDKQACIFVHVPKTAGTSIALALLGDRQPGHTTAEYFRYYDSQRFSRYFKFAFVRNPWDRFVSAYCYLKRLGGTPIDRYVAGRYLARTRSFNEFVDLIHGSRRFGPLRDWLHFRPQTDFLCDSDGIVLLDFIGYYERLAEDFAHVCRNLSIEAELATANTSERPAYADFYDHETRDKIAELYESDIRTFNYSFD